MIQACAGSLGSTGIDTADTRRLPKGFSSWGMTWGKREQHQGRKLWKETFQVQKMRVRKPQERDEPGEWKEVHSVRVKYGVGET
jgi:hypothetical protein